MTKEIWESVENFILKTLSIVHNSLEEDAVKTVKHYVYHNELEMAFEGLFIDIMKLKVMPQIDLFQSERMALLLNLDKESVFDDDFWLHFEMFIHGSLSE